MAEGRTNEEKPSCSGTDPPLADRVSPHPTLAAVRVRQKIVPGLGWIWMGKPNGLPMRKRLWDAIDAELRKNESGSA